MNLTKLKDMLLAEVPELEAYKKVGNVLMAFKKIYWSSLVRSIQLFLAKAAKILQMHVIDHKSKFEIL